MKSKTLTGKTVTVEVIKHSKRKTAADTIKYVSYDGSGRRKSLTGEAAMSIHRKTF